MERFITVAIHTYDKAIALRSLLESQGIEVEFRNVNIENPVISAGVRVRIREADLPLALRIIENREIFADPVGSPQTPDSSRPIIVPVDFSENSFLAAKSAFIIAARHQTNIMLLHTYIDPYIAGNMQLTDSLTYEIADNTTRQQIEETAKAQMRHFSNRLKESIKTGEIPPVQFKTTVLEGVPEDAITEYTRANTPYLIVMGTRGPQKKEMDMIGSVTAEVLDKCRFTVLALPEPPEPGHDSLNIKNVLFFSNVDQQDILAVDTLHRYFPDLQINVTIVALPSKKRPFTRNYTEAANALKDYCTRNFDNYTFKTVALDSENTLDHIRQLEQNTKFDLVVVPNKKKNIFSRLFNPSLAHRILFSSEIPILVIPV